MSFSPVLICSGALGLLSGAVAIAFRKGSRRHRLAGNVFVVSMLGLGASGAYMAIMKFQPGNILGGTFTFYLVATAWMTARRRDGEPGIFDWVAFLVVSAIAAIEVTLGFAAMYSQTGMKYGYPAGPYFFIGSVALLAVIGDVRLLARRGISGAQRLVRHLWRMCFGLFIASGSIFLARPHLFPGFMRKTGVLYLLTFLPLILMVFWLLRVRLTNAHKNKSASSSGEGYSLRTQPSR